ncbi:MAG: hypothetical protein KF724_04315 [Phycisphaeraceae bacterium]|nr:hypothetical protein [Phycisphaeraceae bacterium]
MPLPRGLILLASAWLFLSWIASMGIQPPLIAATSSYTPAVRLMILSSAIGAMVAWPLLRLSQGPTRTPWRDTVLDLIVVLGMVNMVLWPLRLVTPWPPVRMALIMAMLAIGVLTVGAIVAAATPSARRWVRTTAMALVLLVALGAMPLRAVAPQWVAPFPSVHGGPLEALLALASPGGAPPAPRDWAAAEGALGVALVAWALALLVGVVRRRRERSRDERRGLLMPAHRDRLEAWS